MKAGIAATVALAAAFAGQAMAAEQPAGSGNELLVQCQNAIHGMNTNVFKNPFDTGMCFGTVGAVMTMATFYKTSVENDIRICIPAGVTTGQGARIVVKFLQDRPELLNDDRAVLTWMALINSYPCKK